jgi:hypothetical protein
MAGRGRPASRRVQPKYVLAQSTSDGSAWPPGPDVSPTPNHLAERGSEPARVAGRPKSPPGKPPWWLGHLALGLGAGSGSGSDARRGPAQRVEVRATEPSRSRYFAGTGANRRAYQPRPPSLPKNPDGRLLPIRLSSSSEDASFRGAWPRSADPERGRYRPVRSAHRATTTATTTSTTTSRTGSNMPDSSPRNRVDADSNA